MFVVHFQCGFALCTVVGCTMAARGLISQTFVEREISILHTNGGFNCVDKAVFHSIYYNAVCECVNLCIVHTHSVCIYNAVRS